MKKQIIRNAAIFSLFLMVAVVSVNAQVASRAEVKIPFDFSAGKATLKAGTYQISRTSTSILKIRSLDGKTVVLVNAPLSISARDSKFGERLVFNQYDDKYFLSQVWLSVENGQQIFPASDENKIAREFKHTDVTREPQRIAVALREK